MELCIGKVINFKETTYYIRTLEYMRDKSIASLLGLSINEYQNIVKRFNSYIRSDGELFFKNKEDAEKCIEILETYYLIMKRLTGE